MYDEQKIDFVGFPENEADTVEAQADAASVEKEKDREVFNRLRLVPEPGQNAETATDAEPEVADPALEQLTQAEPETTIQDSPLAELMATHDPFERYGLDGTRANEIAYAAQLSIQPDDVPDFMAAMERAGVHDEDSFRQFCGFVKREMDTNEKEQAKEARLAELEERVREREERGPGSPLDERLSRIESALTTQRQEAEQIQQAEAYVMERSGMVIDAVVMLADEAKRRGIEAPDANAMGSYIRQLAFMPPGEAARLAWLGAGGDPGVFGSRRGADKPYHATANPSGYRTHKGEIRSAPQHVPGEPARRDESLEDLLNY